MFKQGKIKRGVALVLVALLVMSVMPTGNRAMAAGKTYYVSVTGNDTTGDGSIGNPWKTIQKAASTMTAGDVCEIRAGVYRETIRPTNSGTSANPIIFRAYSGESVTVSGAEAVTGWTQHSGNIYKAPMSFDPMAVYVNAVDMVEARWPNKNGLNKLRLDDLGRSDAGSSTTLRDADLHGANDYWNGAFIWFTGGGGHTNWTAQTSTVTGYNSSTKTLTITKPQVDLWHRVPGKNSYFYLTGKLSELDAENEWHYENGQLYLWAPGGVDPSTVTVEAKSSRKWGFDLSGKNHIQLKDINVFAASANLENATHCVIDNCDFKYVSSDPTINYTYSRGGYGDHTKLAPWWDSTWNDVGVYIGGSHNVLKNSEVAYSYGDCVTVTGNNNTVKNNILHEANISATECGVISVIGSGHDILANTMYNGGRSILQFNYVEASRFMYNDMYEPGKMSRDLGVAYCYITDGKGTEIAYNWVHDNHCDGAGAGIYLDNGSRNFVLHHNVVWDSPTGWGIFYNVPADNMQSYNNTVWKSGGTHGVQFDEPMTNSITRNNLSDKPFEGNTISNNVQSADPKFVGGRDDGLQFQLQAGSPAIDAGMSISGITTGHQGSAPDAGAYEYGGTAWVAGHTVDVSHLPALPVAPVLDNIKFNNAEKGISFTAGWDYFPAYYDFPQFRSSYRADIHIADDAGDTFEYAFRGSYIEWVGAKGPDYGMADVYIDGVLVQANVDSYNPSFQTQATLFSKGGLSQGNHTIKVVVKGNKNSASTGNKVACDALYSKLNSDSAASIANAKNDTNNLARTGKGRETVKVHDQFGNALTVMTDGIKATTNSADSWNGGVKSEDYWGLSFSEVYGFNKVVYTTGKPVTDGGWFASGLKVQVKQNGTWVDVTSQNISPAYPYNQSAANNQTYTFTFDDTWGDAIRIYGVPVQVQGYNFSFTMIGEFEVYYMATVTSGPTIANVKDDSNNLARTGGGRTLENVNDQFGNALTVMTDGIKAVSNSADSWNNRLKSEDYWGLNFTKTYGFNKVVYTTGRPVTDGGWFASGLKVQVKQNGTWVDVTNQNISPAYPYNQSATNNQTYTFTFNDTWGDGIRIYGVPVQVEGYNFAFTMIGEFEVYYAN